jgi:hypothetical protein
VVLLEEGAIANCHFSEEEGETISDAYVVTYFSVSLNDKYCG